MSDRQKIVRAWLKKADQDYTCFKELSNADLGVLENSLFHAQQTWHSRRRAAI